MKVRIPTTIEQTLVAELFKLLPEPGEVFSREDQMRFLKCAEYLFCFIYRTPSGEPK